MSSEALTSCKLVDLVELAVDESQSSRQLQVSLSETKQIKINRSETASTQILHILLRIVAHNVAVLATIWIWIWNWNWKWKWKWLSSVKSCRWANCAYLLLHEAAPALPEHQLRLSMLPPWQNTGSHGSHRKFQTNGSNPNKAARFPILPSIQHTEEDV